MRKGPVVGGAVAAFVIFSGIYLLIAAASGIESENWIVAIVGGVVCAVVAALISLAIARRRSSRPGQD